MSTYSLSQRSKKIIQIALPSAGNALLDIINISVGMYFIANISADSEIATSNIVALGLGLNYWMFLFALTTIFYIGTNTQISHAFGQKNYSKLSQILTTMSIGALIFSIPIYILTHLSNELFFDWMGIEGITKELGMTYLSWLFFGIPALFLKTIFISSLAGIGDTKSAFFIKILATLLNIILNFALILGIPEFGVPQLGITGAGISNVIITYLETGLFLFILCVSHRQLRFNWHIKLQKDALRILKNTINTGLPSGIERGLTILSLVLIAKFMTDYGLEIIAGFQIGSRVESFIFMPGFGFQVAAMALVGQMIGAQRLDLAYAFIRTTLLISSIIMGILGVGLCIWGREFSSVFSSDPIVINHAFYYLIAVGLSQVPLIWIFVLDGALRGSGATRLSLLINTGSIWILRIIPMWLCVFFKLDVRLIFAIICIETFVRATIFAFVIFKGVWERYIVRF